MAFDPRGVARCHRCFLRAPRCLCAALTGIPTRTRVLVLRHMMERWKPSNSGRLVALALGNARLADHGTREDEPADRADLEDFLAELDAPDTWLLWPDGERAAPGCKRLVVIDGSWSQARRMVQRLPRLRALPRFAVTDKIGGGARLRRAPEEGALSTAEAVASALAALGEEDAAFALEHLRAEWVRRSVP